MATVKVVLRKKRNKDGSFPLAIRVTKNRNSTYAYLGHSLKVNQWDTLNQRVKKVHPNSARLNNFILKKLSETTDRVLELETNGDNVTTTTVKNLIAREGKGQSFFTLADDFLKNLKQSRKYNRYSAEKPYFNRFSEFLKNEEIAFVDITIRLLKKYQAYLKGTRNVSERTISNHLIAIRTIYNQAIKEGMVDRKHYPFGKDKIRITFPDSLKVGLNEVEVQLIEEVKLSKGSRLNHVRNIWLFSFYFAGMRISDVLRLRWSDFSDERLYYVMGKNAKTGSLKVPDKALGILRQYEGDKQNEDDLVFPELKILHTLDDRYKAQQKISNAVKVLNESLKKIAELVGIQKKLTLHIARHTFGHISGERISVQMLQKLYRHSSIITTIGYQANFIHKDTDEALDSVVGF